MKRLIPPDSEFAKLWNEATSLDELAVKANVARSSLSTIACRLRRNGVVLKSHKAKPSPFIGVYSELRKRWKHVLKRCAAKKGQHFRIYSERGITVCDEWKANFMSFAQWAIENGYAPELELDRRNTNGNYEPSNCRWVTRRQNSTNSRKRANTSSRYKGVWWSNTSNRWIVSIEVNGKSVHGGTYTDETIAAKAYDDLARRHFGDHAHLNFKE